MKRNSYIALSIAVLGLTWSAIALAGDGRTCPGATTNPTSALLQLREWNDCPASTLTATNSFPAMIEISDQNVDCFGYTNLHSWGFSADGGASRIQFENCSAYHFCADVTVTGNGNGEAGLILAPWWWPSAGGKFMLNVTNGEIACFDGRLPFYSFTAAYGITYVRGTTVHMEMTYLPHGLSSADPATVEYAIRIGATSYSSGPRPFDEGNTTQDPPHGLWGALNPHYAGGYFQPNAGGGASVGLTARFSEICFDNLQATPTTPSTWGRVKTLYR